MPLDYQSLAATAGRLITENGRSATWRQLRATGGPAHDPHTLVHADYPIRVVVVPVGRVGKESKKAMPSTAQPAGSQRILVDALGNFTPKQRDTVIIGADTFNVENITEINPGGLAVLYKVELSK